MNKVVLSICFLATFTVGGICGALLMPIIAPECILDPLRKEIDAQWDTAEKRLSQLAETLKEKGGWLFQGNTQEIRLFRPDTHNEIYELATVEELRTVELTHKSKRLYFLDTKLSIKEQCRVKLGFDLKAHPIVLALSEDKQAVVITVPAPEVLSCTRVDFAIKESMIPISTKDREHAERSLREALYEDIRDDEGLRDKARESFRQRFLSLPEMQLLLKGDVRVIFRFEDSADALESREGKEGSVLPYTGLDALR